MPTNIAWADESWNPIRAMDAEGKMGWGCVRISSGCANCYAEGVNGRWGTGLPYTARGIEQATHYLDEHALTQPLRWRRPRRIFLSSMTDVFGSWVMDEQLDRMFAVMALSAQHTFLILTKRAARMREYGEREAAALGPLPNVWLGVSVEDQKRADERIPALLATPAAKRFLSCEPLLEAVDLRRHLGGSCRDCGALTSDPATRLTDVNWFTSHSRGGEDGHVTGTMFADLCGPVTYAPGLDWVIAGGESGPNARPCDLAWLRSLRDQCAAAGVAYFCKQLGSRPTDGYDGWRDPNQRHPMHLRSRHGSDPEEWPADLRVQEFPR